MAFKGSRKHVLDLLDSSQFVSTVNSMLLPYGGALKDTQRVQPKGIADDAEYELQYFISKHDLASTFPSLTNFNFNKWWNPYGGKAPTWDLMAVCQLNGNDAILLVEAKAHISEFDTYGKKEARNPSEGSIKNRISIKTNIDEACAALNVSHTGFNISIDRHYQLSNRVAFARKLKQMNVPVVLLYLGFTGDQYFNDYFIDDKHWKTAFNQYLKNVVPIDFINSPTSDFLFIESSLPVQL